MKQVFIAATFLLLFSVPSMSIEEKLQPPAEPAETTRLDPELVKRIKRSSLDIRRRDSWARFPAMERITPQSMIEQKMRATLRQLAKKSNMNPQESVHQTASSSNQDRDLNDINRGIPKELLMGMQEFSCQKSAAYELIRASLNKFDRGTQDLENHGDKHYFTMPSLRQSCAEIGTAIELANQASKMLASKNHAFAETATKLQDDFDHDRANHEKAIKNLCRTIYQADNNTSSLGKMARELKQAARNWRSRLSVNVENSLKSE